MGPNWKYLLRFFKLYCLLLRLGNSWNKFRYLSFLYGGIQTLRGQDEGGRGSKNVCFCPRSGYKDCPRRGGGGQKMAKFCPRSIVVECPLTKIEEKNSWKRNCTKRIIRPQKWFTLLCQGLSRSDDLIVVCNFTRYHDQISNEKRRTGIGMGDEGNNNTGP